MQAHVRNSDGVIIGFGQNIADTEGASVITLTDSQLQIVIGQTKPVGGFVLNSDYSISVIPPSPPPPPPPPPPNIADLISALTQSPSLDQGTKDKLIQALRGQ